ncbi:hypothetical protein D3C77_680680 [compost metagenome]
MTLHERADQQGREVVAHGERGTDIEGAKAGLAVEQILDFTRLVHQRHGLRQQLAAQGIEAEALAGAVEQLAPGLALKFG